MSKYITPTNGMEAKAGASKHEIKWMLLSTAQKVFSYFYFQGQLEETTTMNTYIYLFTINKVNSEHLFSY